MTARAEGAESGSSEVTAPLTCDGEVTIAFDPDYIVQFLRACDADEIRIEMTSAEKPAVFVVDGGYKYLVMPLAG